MKNWEVTRRDRSEHTKRATVSFLLPVLVRTRMMASNPMLFCTSFLRSLRKCSPSVSICQQKAKTNKQSFSQQMAVLVVTVGAVSVRSRSRHKNQDCTYVQTSHAYCTVPLGLFYIRLASVPNSLCRYNSLLLGIKLCLCVKLGLLNTITRIKQLLVMSLHAAFVRACVRLEPNTM